MTLAEVLNKKEEAHPRAHFMYTGRIDARINSDKELFRSSVLQQPGEEFDYARVCFHLLGALVDVKRTDRVDLVPVIGAKARIVFVHNPLAAPWGFTPVHLFTHLVQPYPRFRLRVGAAPIAKLN